MTDADVDGAHIASLLITFFYQEMPELIENGHLYPGDAAALPLTHGAKSVYARDDKHKDELLKTRVQAGQRQGRDQPLQGPGRDEAAQLKETTMDPSKRTLLRSTSATATGRPSTEAVNALMGSKPEARFRFIQERAAFAKDLDI